MAVANLDDRVDEAIQRFDRAASIAHDFANRPAGAYIPTESGNIPSIAEFISQQAAAIGNFPGLIAGAGSQNLFFNPDFRKEGATVGVAEGWMIDAPGSGGVGTPSLVASWLVGSEKAQRLDVTGLNASSIYRGIRPVGIGFWPKAKAGSSIVASCFIRATAGLTFRIFFQAVDASGASIAGPAGPLVVATGATQRISYDYPNLPANTAGVQVYFRVYGSSTVTSGFVEYTRTQFEIGTSLSGWKDNTSLLQSFDSDLTNRTDPLKGVAVLGRAWQGATSVAQLRTLKTNGPSRYAATSGYYEQGDGGASMYFVPDSFAGLVDNGLDAIKADDGGFWRLNHSGVINILQAGAKTDKAYDCTTAIKNAISVVSNYANASRGGKVIFPNSWFNVTGSLDINSPFVTLEGASKQGPMIRSLTPGQPVIRTYGSYNAIVNLEITYASQATSGGGIEIYGANFIGDNTTVSNAFNGYHFRGGSAHVLNSPRAFDCSSTGFLFNGDSGFINDVFIENWLCVTNDQTKFDLGHFRAVGRVEAIMVGKGDGIGGKVAFTCDAVGGPGLRYSTFSSCFWDSTDGGAQFTDAHFNSYINCWSSNGRGKATAGVTHTRCTNFSWIGGKNYNCGAAGMRIDQCTDFVVVGTDCSSNSLDTDGAAAGLAITNSSKFALGKNTGVGVRQFAGCLIDASNDFTVDGNAWGANKNGPLIVGDTCTNNEVTGNRGYSTRKLGSTTLPASALSTTVTHGLSRTPILAGIRIQMNGASQGPLYVTAANATTFTVATLASNTGATPFSWEASAEIAP